MADRSEASDESERLDITKGQRAMAHAWLYPDAKHGGARKKGSTSETKLDGFSAARVSQARKVLAFSRELAEAVAAFQRARSALRSRGRSAASSNNIQTNIAYSSCRS